MILHSYSTKRITRAGAQSTQDPRVSNAGKTPYSSAHASMIPYSRGPTPRKMAEVFQIETIRGGVPASTWTVNRFESGASDLLDCLMGMELKLESKSGEVIRANMPAPESPTLVGISVRS